MFPPGGRSDGLQLPIWELRSLHGAGGVCSHVFGRDRKSLPQGREEEKEMPFISLGPAALCGSCHRGLPRSLPAAFVELEVLILI